MAVGGAQYRFTGDRATADRIDAFGTTYEAICPAVFDEDMAVVWQR